MEEQKQVNEEWREEISEPKDTLRIEPDSSIAFTFLDEGVKKTHPDFGTSVSFGVMPDGEKEKRIWFVSANNYNLLGQIKGIGKLTGVRVKVHRKGAKRSDTRYTISRIDTP